MGVVAAGVKGWMMTFISETRKGKKTGLGGSGVVEGGRKSSGGGEEEGGGKMLRLAPIKAVEEGGVFFRLRLAAAVTDGCA